MANKGYQIQGGLAYQGVAAPTPANTEVHSRAPNTNDSKGRDLGTYWLHREGRDDDPAPVRDMWVLVSLEGNDATWVLFTSVNGSLIYLEGDSGGPVPPDGSGVINVVGDGVSVTVTGDPGTNTLTISAGDSSIDFETDDGTATPAAGVLEILGGELINTEGAGNTVTINLDQGDDGEIPIGATGGATLYANITSTDGSVTITNGPNTIDLAASTSGGGGVDQWNEITDTSEQMEVNEGYVTNNVALVTLTLPAVADFGDVVRVAGKGAGGWLIAQNAGQTIYFGTSTTTTGVGGSLASTEDRDCLELLCVTDNIDWEVLSSIGDITVV